MGSNTKIVGLEKMLNNINNKKDKVADAYNENEDDDDDDINKDTETADEFLSALYYDPLNPAGYVGLDKLWNVVKSDNPHNLSKKYVRDWLNEQDSYKRHKPPPLNFPRERIVMSYMDQQWDADIMDMSKFSKFNNGYKYIAVFIDIFSRYAWVEIMKTKKPTEMVNVMKNVFSEGRKPEYLRTDKGSEYTGIAIKTYMRSKQIKHFTTVNVIHASYAERFIRTLKGKLYRYFTKQNTYKYINILQDLVDSYLDTVHNTTGYKPSSINHENEQEIYEKLYLPVQLKIEAKQIKYKYSVGDYVHLSVERRTFHKGYKDSYTQEIFVISRRIRSDPPRYKVKDLLDEEIEGTCYEAELQPTKYSDDMVFPIEKVLYYVTKNKVRMAKVRWQGYPPKFDSLVPVSDMEKKYILADSVKETKVKQIREDV